jgi:hypothetical protein
VNNFTEQGTLTAPNGREVTSGGAVVNDDYLICYADGEAPGATVTTWHGIPIGTVTKISSRPARWFGHCSCWSRQYFYMRVRLADGREYACQGFGKGFAAKGKRVGRGKQTTQAATAATDIRAVAHAAQA